MSERLDNILVNRGLVETRSRARDLVKRGQVKVNGIVASKPAANTQDSADIEITGSDSHYVSRGALKLKAALEHFTIDLNGAIAIDLGASTGGFCQVLLEQGAAKVYAVDVGTGQLHKTIAGHPSVVSLENQDARKLTVGHISDAVHIVTSDLSFISQTQALNPALTFAIKGAYLITLIKPQFEAGRDAVGKGGIVRDEAVRNAAIDKVRSWVSQQPGWNVIDVIPSPITGQGGNQEYLLGAILNE